MGQSLSRVLLHIVFSTKHRRPMLDEEVRPHLFAYMAGVLKNLDCPALEIGGDKDHVHILCLMSRDIKIKELLEEIKKPTSKWMKAQGSRYAQFYWQSGYGVFSISESAVEDVRQYIRNQPEHHKKITFQDELRAFLTKYKVPFDEKYVWD